MTETKHPEFIPPEDRPTVELVHPSYQPSRAELEEVIPPPKNMSVEDVAKALLKPVNVRYVRRPTKR